MAFDTVRELPLSCSENQSGTDSKRARIRRERAGGNRSPSLQYNILMTFTAKEQGLLLRPSRNESRRRPSPQTGATGASQTWMRIARRIVYRRTERHSREMHKVQTGSQTDRSDCEETLLCGWRRLRPMIRVSYLKSIVQRSQTSPAEAMKRL